MKRNLFIKPQLQLKLKHRAMESPKMALKPLAWQGWDRNQTWSPQITFLDTKKGEFCYGNYFRGKRILRKPETGEWGEASHSASEKQPLDLFSWLCFSEPFRSRSRHLEMLSHANQGQLGDQLGEELRCETTWQQSPGLGEKQITLFLFVSLIIP